MEYERIDYEDPIEEKEIRTIPERIFNIPYSTAIIAGGLLASLWILYRERKYKEMDGVEKAYILAKWIVGEMTPDDWMRPFLNVSVWLLAVEFIVNKITSIL